MTGVALLGLILLSMAWLFFLAALTVNYVVLVRWLRAKPGGRVPASLGFVPGLAGSLAMVFSLPALKRLGVELSWPWVWVVLPLLIDPYCIPLLALLLIRRFRK